MFRKIFGGSKGNKAEQVHAKALQVTQQGKDFDSIMGEVISFIDGLKRLQKFELGSEN